MKKRMFAVFAAVLMLICAAPVTAGAAAGPSVLKCNAPMITDNAMAVLNAKISFTNGEKIKKVYFYYRKMSVHDYTRVTSNPKSLGKYMKQITGLAYSTDYKYIAKVVTDKGTYKSAPVYFTTPEKQKWSATDPVKATVAEKYAYLFGNAVKAATYKSGNPPPGYYKDGEARKHVTSVTVKVWKLYQGKKYSSTMTFKINKKLANNVKAIFSEIYDLKFPIHDITTYKYRIIGGPGLAGSRSISKHSFGCAIDVNRYVNGYYIGYDGRDSSSPYYLTDDVVNVFKKYGWVWDGDAPKYIDTMHFQYLNDITVTP